MKYKLRHKYCPHCGAKLQYWKKQIISTAAASLVRLVVLYQGDPIHHDNFTVLMKDRNFSQLVLWGLVIPGKNINPEKRASGMWAPTEKGVNFVFNKTTVPRYVTTLNNTIINFSGEMVNITDVLGQKFNYKELLLLNY